MPPSSPVRETVTIHAPIERCWALSTRVEIVQKTLGMKLVGGVTHGSIQAGSRVVWRGWKFGLPTAHHTLITRFETPHANVLSESHPTLRKAFFQDTQEKGRFAEFHHDHFFREEAEGGTILTDEVYFRLPFGLLGELIAARLMAPYIRKLTRRRFAVLKELAEGEGWRSWISTA